VAADQAGGRSNEVPEAGQVPPLSLQQANTSAAAAAAAPDTDGGDETGTLLRALMYSAHLSRQ
jgi:hypothetical protein